MSIPSIEVVDGQQRLTDPELCYSKAIQLVACGFTPSSPLSCKGILIKQDELSLILLQMNHDPNGYFSEYLRHGKSSDPFRRKGPSRTGRS